MTDMVDAVAKSYLEYCEREYRRGWAAQDKTGVAEEEASQMYLDGFSDAYAYGEMMSNRRAAR